MIQENLTVSTRSATGKGVCRKMRGSGELPAVVYGVGQPPQPISLPKKSLLDLLRIHDTNMLVNLNFEDDTSLNSIAIVKDLQVNPVNRRVFHVDFLRISLDKPLEVLVPIHQVGVCKGVKMGGNLEVVKREVLIEALPVQIPEFIEIDITNVDMGENLHIRDIIPPEGIKILDDPKRTILTVHGKVNEEDETSEEGDAE